MSDALPKFADAIRPPERAMLTDFSDLWDALDRATPGEWGWREARRVKRGTPNPWPHLTLCGPEPEGNPIITGDRASEEIMANAAFIALAHNRLPALRERLARLERVLSALCDAAEDCYGWASDGVTAFQPDCDSESRRLHEVTVAARAILAEAKSVAGRSREPR